MTATLGTLTLTLTILAFFAPRLTELREHTARYRDGFTPAVTIPVTGIVFVTLGVTGYAAMQLATRIPVLQWGWLGHNALIPSAAVTGNTDTSANEGADTGSAGVEAVIQHVTPVEVSGDTLAVVSNTVSITVILTFLGVLVTAFLILSYDEETWGRETWGHVGVWAVAHLIMGIPVFAVIPIFASGVIFKLVHDVYGFNPAYTVHVTVNSIGGVFIAFVLVIITVL